MGVLIVPGGFDPQRPGPLPPGQTLNETREAARVAQNIEDRVERAAHRLEPCDEMDGVDLAPGTGHVKVRDYRAPGAAGTPIDADLDFEPESSQLQRFTARWGDEELRFRQNDQTSIWSWNDRGQLRKVTEDRTTGTLYVFQDG